MNTDLLDQARRLSVEDQLELVEALWDEITKRQHCSTTDARSRPRFSAN